MKIRWYHDTAIQFELVKNMVARETAFLSMTKKGTQRCLKIHKVEFLRRNFDRYQFFNPEYCYNIYTSISRYQDMPMMSFRQDKKHEEMALFNINAEKHIISHDFAIDIDNKDLDVAYQQTKRVKEIYDFYKIPYRVSFSGTKGFHLVVSHEDLPDSLRAKPFKEQKDIFKMFAYELKTYHGLDSIDLTIYDLRRILKTPYSVVYPFYYVSLPLSDEQFKTFKLKDVFLPELVQRTETFRGRGLLKRVGDKQGFVRMLQEISKVNEMNAELFKMFKWDKEYLFGKVKGW